MDKDNEELKGWNITNNRTSSSQQFRESQRVPNLNSSKKNTHSKKTKKIKGAKSLDKRRFKGKLLPYILTSAIVIGGVGASHSVYNKTVNTPITLEQSIDYLGKTYDDLGVSEDTIYQLKNLEKQLDSGNLSLNDLASSGNQLKDLELDVIKSKLSQALDVESTSIVVNSSNKSHSLSDETIRVINEGEEQIYTEDNGFDPLSRTNTFSQEISNFIINIGNTQTLAEKASNGNNLDYEEIIESYKEQIQNTYKFAATEISVNKNGDIVVRVTKQNDLPEKSQEKEDLER